MNKSFSVSFKAFAIVALLIGANAGANPEKKACPVPGFICKTWTNVSKAFNEKKGAVVAFAQGMRARGWNALTTNEKAGVVIGGTVVAATTGYLVYKLFKSFTAPKAKVKASVRNSRA